MCDPHRPGGNELQKYNQASNTIPLISLCMRLFGFVQEDEAGTV